MGIQKRKARIIAWGLLFCLLTPDAVRAFPVDIPAGLGTARQATGPDGPLIVHVQDAHANFQAQKNIRRLLRHLTRREGFSLIFLEGGATPLDPSLFRVFRDRGRNEKFAERLVREGELSGAEWFLLGGSPAVKAYGIEDAGLYARDLALFKEVHLRRAVADQFLAEFRAGLDRAARKHLSAQALEFLESRNDFLAKHDFLAHAEALVRAARDILGLDLADYRHQDLYPALSRLAALRRAGEPPEDAVARDRRRLFSFLEGFPEGAAWAKKIEAFPDLPAGNPRRFLERFYETAAPRGFAFRKYPHLARHWKARVLESEINAGAIFAEEEELSGNIFKAVAAAPGAAETVRLFEDASRLEKLLRLELARQQYSRLAEDPSRVKPSVLAARLNRMHPAGTGRGEALRAADDLFLKALDFYRFAEMRELAFVENAARRMEREGIDRAVIVTGGFHGDGLARQFARKNFGYVAVRPEISSAEKKDTDRYLRAMLARRETRFDASQINKALVLLEEDDLIPRLTGLTRDPEYPAYLARQVADAAADAAPGREALVEFSASRLARVLGIRVDPGTGDLEFLRAAALGSDRAGIENPFWTNTKKRLGRLRDRGYVTEEFYQSLFRMHAVHERDLSVRDNGLFFKFHANRVQHSVARGPAKGGIRLLYAMELGIDRVFMETLEKMKASGATLEEANAFLDRWVREMTMALAVEMSFKTALMDLPLGGAKSVISLAKIVERDGKFVPESLLPSKAGRPTGQELANVARALARYYAEEGIVGPEIDSPAPDRNTDPLFMTWMTDEHLKVLLEKHRRGERTPLDRDGELIGILKDVLRYDTLKTMVPTETPFLERAVQYSLRKGIKVPELAIYTGKPESLGGQSIRDQSTGLGTLMLAEMIAEKNIWPGQVDTARIDIKHPVQTKRVAIQGFGNVGRNAAILFSGRGAPVVAVSDVSRGIYHSRGFGSEDLARLASFLLPQRDRPAKYLRDFAEIGLAVERQFEPETFLTDIPPVDILIPAAVEGAISARNVDGIRVTVVLPAANGAVTMEAEERLWSRTVRTYVFPDILASAGGVTVSYREMVENTVKSASRWGQKKSVRWLRAQFQKTFDALWEMVEREPGIHFGLAADRIAAERLQAAYASSLGEASGFAPVWLSSGDLSDDEKKAVELSLAGFSDVLRGYRETGIADTLWVVYDPAEPDTKTARIANFWNDPAHVEELEQKYGVKIPEDGVLVILGPNFRELPREQWTAALKHELYHPWVDAALGNTFYQHYRLFLQGLQRSSYDAEDVQWQAFVEAVMEYQATRFKAERGDLDAALFDYEHVFHGSALPVFQKHITRLSYEEVLGEILMVFLTGYQAFRYKDVARATAHWRQIDSELEPVFGRAFLDALLPKILLQFLNHASFLKMDLPDQKEFEQLLDLFESLRNDAAAEGLFIKRKAELLPPPPLAGSLGEEAVPERPEEEEASLRPIHPALGVRLSESVFVLKDEVHAAVGRIHPDFASRRQLPDEITAAFYRSFIAALRETGTPRALGIAAAFPDEEEGLRHLKEALEFRGPVRAFMIESKLLGAPARKRMASFVTNAFAASLNRLKDRDQQKAMIVLLSRVYQQALEAGNDMPEVFGRMQAMAIEVVSGFFVSRQISGPDLVSALDLFSDSLRSLRRYWESETERVRDNFRRHYLEPLPARPWGFRLTPDAVVLNATVLAVLREVVPGFEKEPAGTDAGISAEQYFQFLMAVQDRDAGLYARLDKTADGRSVLNRLAGHGPEIARHYFDEEEIFDPAVRSAKFLAAAWTRAIDDRRMPPAVRSVLEDLLRGSAGTVLDPAGFGERLESALAASREPEAVESVRLAGPEVAEYYGRLEESYARQSAASSLGEAAYQVARGAAGNFIDPDTLRENPSATVSLERRLEERPRNGVSPGIAAFNADLAPALRYLGVRLKDPAVPLIVEEKIFGSAAGRREVKSMARKLAEVAGEGAVILLWDYRENRGAKPLLRQEMDAYAARGLTVRDYRLETLNPREMRHALMDFKSPAVLLSTRPEPLSLDLDGEKIRMDLGFLARHGIDPVQALALFKQIADYPAEKRRELFFRAGLDFASESGYWLLGDRFVNSFLAEAYAEAAAQRALSRAA